MKILVKQLSPEVKSLRGWIVYIIDDNENPIVADVCGKDGLIDMIDDFQQRIIKFKSKSVS
jgi:hypothetical protein